MGKFFKTVAIVTVFSVSEKALGFIYRIFMSRTIGAEGMGLYQVAMSVFGLFFTATCSGIPVTVSRLMTKYKAENDKVKERRAISAGIISAFLFSAIIVAVFLIFPSAFSFLFADRRCLDLFLILLPGLLFTSVYSVYRGVFWGNKDFLSYSIIELLEELCMIVVGIILILLSKDLIGGVKGSAIAVTVSFIFSFSLGSIVFFARKNKIVAPKDQLVPLLKSSAPITAMRTVSSLAVSLVSIILPMRLIDAGIPSGEALSSFGSAVGQALPLLFIPTTLIGSFTLVLIPEISENFYKKNYTALKRDTEKALKFTTVISCLFIPVFFSLGKEIGIIVFDNADCGKYLTASAFLTLFMSLSNITTSILNSIGKEGKTLLYYIVSGVLMLLSIWFLPKFFGVYSLLIGFSFVYGISTLLNLLLIKKTFPVPVSYKRFIAFGVISILPVLTLITLLEKLLLPFIGVFFTFIVLLGLCLFLTALFFNVFGLIDVEFIMKRYVGKKLLKKST